MRLETTTCCISGGGPAGIMLGYLLARAGVKVTVLEKWPDFFRDFRGDTIHPSTMQVLRELGLLDAFLALPHNETKEISLYIAGEEAPIADFRYLKNVPPFIAFTPQWDFLTFLSQEAKKYSNFTLHMQTEATDLVVEDGRVCGVRAKNTQEQFEIRAELVVGADGRHSTVREKSGLPLFEYGAPIDVLWFKLPQVDNGAAQSFGYAEAGQVLILLDRDTYWQCAYLIRKGDFPRIQSEGLPALRKSIAVLAPRLAQSVETIQSFDQVKLLAVAVDRLKRWHRPGLLCIGDAAHAMSPVGGVGINLAIQDAVAAANILAPAFSRGGGITERATCAVQARRMWPTRVIQWLQVFIHARALIPALSATHPLRLPLIARLLRAVPYLRRIPAFMVGVGPRSEHVSEFILSRSGEVR